MNILDEIIAVKRDEAAALRRYRSPSSFADDRLFHSPIRSLRAAIGESTAARTTAPASGPAIIAEVKRASPSAGLINASILPGDLGASYASNGATAISVLTDVRFFSGRPEDLEAVRDLVRIPVLRKDFIVDEIQVPESRALGADAILLIASVLEPGRLRDLHDLATGLGMECLVEVHHPDDLAKIDFGNVHLVGINNRNLVDFSIDLETTGRLARLLPPGVTTVSESGLRSAADVRHVARAGVDAVLMGEYFMRNPDPGKCLAELLDELRQD